MKTRVNGKPFINSRACNADLGDQVRRRTGNTTICVKVFRKAGRAWQKGFNIFIVTPVLSDARQPKVNFLHPSLGQYAAHIFGKSVLH